MLVFMNVPNNHNSMTMIMTDYDDDENSSNFVWYNEQRQNTKNVFSVKHNWSAELDTGYDKIVFKLDTGADSSVISKKCYEKLKCKPVLQKSNSDIFGLGEQHVKPIGMIKLVCRYKNKEYTVNCEVIDGNVPNLLSCDDCIKMDLVRRVNVNENCLKVPENVKKCQHESAKNIIKEYQAVFSGTGKVPGEVKLKVDPTVTPVVHPVRTVPVTLRDRVKKKLDELENEDIIEKIPVGTPTPWCSSLHVVLKKNNQVRITIDPRDLNKGLMREYHPTNTVEQVAQRCGSAKYLTVLDANQGYFQLVLDEESRNLTAFDTPFGRYWYKRLPMGISSAPEIFQHVFGDIFAPVAGLEMIMDDFLIAADSQEEHNRILKDTLETCRRNNITLSLKKIQLCTESVKYAGHKFSHKGLEMDEERIKAITHMQEPKNIGEVHTFLGMVTYVCKFLKDLSSITQPLRELIKESNTRGFKWHFDQVHKDSFNLIKQRMTRAPVLRYYSLRDPIVISCDASKSGLGCVLLQNDAPVAYGSRALTAPECAYAQIEKELLAIVHAVKKFHSYIYGISDVTVETDHRSLVRILEKPLHQVPLRLQKMRMKLQGYHFNVVAKRGTEIPVADALSRAYLTEENKNVEIFTVCTHEIVNTTQISPPRLREIQQKTATDPELQTVMQIITDGWPEHRSQADPRARPYFDVQDELTIIDGILYKGQRIIIPASLRKSALTMLHAAHQGIVKTKQLARDLLYWPAINGQIEYMVARFSACQERRPTQEREPLLPMPIPEGPWQHVAQDLFDCLGHKWLMCVDYYSEYFEMERMDNGTQALNVI